MSFVCRREGGEPTSSEVQVKIDACTKMLEIIYDHQNTGNLEDCHKMLRALHKQLLQLGMQADIAQQRYFAQRADSAEPGEAQEENGAGAAEDAVSPAPAAPQ